MLKAIITSQNKSDHDLLLQICVTASNESIIYKFKGSLHNFPSRGIYSRSFNDGVNLHIHVHMKWLFIDDFMDSL